MLIDNSNKTWIRDFYNPKMNDPVTLIVFSQGGSTADRSVEQRCLTCSTSENLATELASVLDAVSVEYADYGTEKAQKLGIYQIPCIAIMGKKDYGIRVYGNPMGYELLPFVETIVDVSCGTTDLGQKAKNKIANLKNNVAIKVFVTPGCPYCIVPVRLAHKFAIENDCISSEMIVVEEFPHLAKKYDIVSVPKIVLNETRTFKGTLSEMQLAEEIVNVGLLLGDGKHHANDTDLISG